MADIHLELDVPPSVGMLGKKKLRYSAANHPEWTHVQCDHTVGFTHVLELDDLHVGLQMWHALHDKKDKKQHIGRRKA